ncbi:MAG: DUF262 domain-containing protein [Clostridia bacterium]|nr:DUF262 domain-containing protein [Clostridia bacterium]
MDAGKRTLNEIFNGSRILEVPFFQRAYVWEKAQWERFLTDIEYVCAPGNANAYFMGSLILKQQMTNASDPVGDVRLVVDGQQRMTTLSILLKVLSLKTGSHKKFEKRFMLDEDIGGPVLRHSFNDEKAYNHIMELTTLEDMQGSDRVTQAYCFFKQNADPQKLNFDTICNRIVFVGIDLNYDEDEQQIFDTINSLGVRLTTAELLKNYFFGREDIEAYKKDWLEIFEKDEETRDYWDQEITTGRFRRTYIDLFFYAFLMIIIQDAAYKVSTEDKNQYSKLDRLFDSYKAFIKKYRHGDKSAIIKEIREYAITFRSAISEKPLQEELPAEAGISRINAIMFALDTVTLVPYVLYLEKNVADLSVRNEMYAFLETYLMRRLVTRQTTKNYNHLFTERLILNQVRTKEDLAQAILDKDASVNRMPTDEEVSEAFHTSVLTNRYAAGVLYLIESKIRNRSRYATQLLGISKYSLEHLMPKKWRNNWIFEGDNVLVAKRDREILTLGNLAIITQALNASIRDADWETKKVGKGNLGGLKKYAEGIETLSEYLDEPVWNEELIYKRADYLAQNALTVWPV